MEIVLYKNSVGKYYRVYELGDLTDAGAFPGGISQATGGNNPLSRGGSRDTLPVVPTLSDRVNILDQNVPYKTDPQKPASLNIYREAYFPEDPELVSLSITLDSNFVHMNNWGEGQYTRADVYLGIATISGVEHIGFFAYNTYNGNWGFLSQENESDACGQFLKYAEVEASPGEKGFRPTGDYTSKDKPGIGGRGSEPGPTPRYKGDPVTQPGAPDESHASAVGSGFINCYEIDTANLAKVGQCLYGSTLLGLIQSLAINPLDFIISLMVFPAKPDVGAAENIKLGGWLAAAAGGAALGFDASGNRLASEFKVVDFGTVQIPENWGSFLDYQSQIELYLPFVGTVSIDVSECMAGSINVQYTIDFFTGMCVANVLCSKPAFVLPNGEVIQDVVAQHAYQGNCAIQIPLSAVNYGNMVGSLINACTQGITNPVMGLVNGLDTGISGGFRPTVTSKGNIVANSGFCSVLYPYVRLTRPITAEPDSYQEVMGYPSYVNTTLGECEDLCVCDDIDLKGITGATDNEINRIRQLCKEGVYV